MQLFVIVFQTLHMKEEENKRLNQRLVNIYFINLYVNMRVVTVLALIFHQNVLIVWERCLTWFKLIICIRVIRAWSRLIIDHLNGQLKAVISDGK